MFFSKDEDREKGGKVSLEGEGIRLGLKTVFFRYPDNRYLKEGDAMNIYINTEVMDSWLKEYCADRAAIGKFITLETYRNVPQAFLKIPNLIVFRNVTEFEEIKSYDNLYIKLRVLNKKQLEPSIVCANRFAKDHFRRVLLMPEYRCNYKKLLSGDSLQKVDWGVRFMPPVQDIINIP